MKARTYKRLLRAASGQAHGDAALDGAGIYAAEDITHPDGVTGVVAPKLWMQRQSHLAAQQRADYLFWTILLPALKSRMAGVRQQFDLGKIMW